MWRNIMRSTKNKKSFQKKKNKTTSLTHRRKMKAAYLKTNNVDQNSELKIFDEFVLEGRWSCHTREDCESDEFCSNTRRYNEICHF